MKLFKTSNIDVVECCQDHFGFDLLSVSWSKRVKKFEAKFHAYTIGETKLYIMCHEYAENELRRQWTAVIILILIPRDAMHPRYNMPWPCVRPSVCLSVCLSVTSRCSTITPKRRITQTTPHDSLRTLSFLTPKISEKFDQGHPYGGTKCRWGGSKSATVNK